MTIILAFRKVNDSVSNSLKHKSFSGESNAETLSKEQFVVSVPEDMMAMERFVSFVAMSVKINHAKKASNVLKSMMSHFIDVAHAHLDLTAMTGSTVLILTNVTR